MYPSFLCFYKNYKNKYKDSHSNLNRKESENVEEVDNLIKALAVHISEIISSGKEREHEVAEKAKALADLMSARATTY